MIDLETEALVDNLEVLFTVEDKEALSDLVPAATGMVEAATCTS
jgi:hypothetical protein